MQRDDDAPDAALAEWGDDGAVAASAVLDCERLRAAFVARRFDSGVEVGVADRVDQGRAESGRSYALGGSQRLAGCGVEVGDASVGVEREHRIARGGEGVLELGALGLALPEQFAGAAHIVGDSAQGLRQVGVGGWIEGDVARTSGADCFGQPPPGAMLGDDCREQEQQPRRAERDAGGDAPAALGGDDARSDPDQRREQRGPRRRRARPPAAHRSNR